jgi:transaldolase
VNKNKQNPIERLHLLGQSIWYDNIQRRLLENGELAGMIARSEIRGITSNPSIFQNAIARSHDYDQAMMPMALDGRPAEDIFAKLAFDDIRAAADLFIPLYEKTNGGDGYVSLEVNPFLAHDTQGTIREAQILWNAIQRPNLMIKIPGTVEGIPAIWKSIASGINVNVTLIFSLARYSQIIDAYQSGLEERLEKGLLLSGLASVASFFVSRVDTKVDARLQTKLANGGDQAELIQSLLGKAAIANAKLAYEIFCKNFNNERFLKLQEKGAKKQRPLWASTSTKNPTYPDIMYVEELIGPDTVNTVPPQTLTAFLDHGDPKITLGCDAEGARAIMDKLKKIGVDIDVVTQELEQEGVKAFSDAYEILLKTIGERKIIAQSSQGITTNK